MYDHLKGELIELNDQQAIVNVGGIGFSLYVPIHVLQSAIKVGEIVRFYTVFVVRELSHTLYGFLEKTERALFETLIDLSGVGPKTALSLIGHLGVNGLHEAVCSGNLSALVKVPGIGKKTAERLMVELKGKTVGGPSIGSGALSEAIRALIQLGYPESKAQMAVTRAQDQLQGADDLSSLISTALRLSKSLT